MSAAPQPMEDLAAGRRLGYRLFGRAFDFVLHTRPAEWPIMAGHTALGWLLATGVAGAWAPTVRGPALLGLALWVVGLNGGTLAINSAFDDDEGDVAYLRRPPKPPRGLFAFGMALMIGGLAWAVAAELPIGYLVAYAVCLLMSVAYSVPPIRLKAVAGADWVINIVGFGSLTPYAGWAATGRPVTVTGVWLFVSFGALFAALYPLTQLYQVEEDQRRGDRTLTIRLGIPRALTAALGAAALAFTGFATALAGTVGASTPNWAALGIAAAAWAAVLVPWRAAALSWTSAQHQRGMHLALGAWAVTDVVCLVIWGR
jgi:4-hydroxybenzoate polyprenyltransferase